MCCFPSRELIMVLNKATVLFLATLVLAVLGASTLVFSDADVKLLGAISLGASDPPDTVQR
jgi:hypothetical protein